MTLSVIIQFRHLISPSAPLAEPPAVGGGLRSVSSLLEAEDDYADVAAETEAAALAAAPERNKGAQQGDELLVRERGVAGSSSTGSRAEDVSSG